MGRFGLFEPDSFAIRCSSVEGCQFLLDPDGLPERAVEGPPRDRSFEARQPTAGVGPTPRFGGAGHEASVLCDKAKELALDGLPPTADAAPDRLRHAAGGVSSTSSATGDFSTGIPAGTCSGSASSEEPVSSSLSSSAAAGTLSGA